MSKFLTTAGSLFLLLAAFALVVDRAPLAAAACGFAGVLTIAVAIAAYGAEIAYDRDRDGGRGTSASGTRPRSRPWCAGTRWRAAAVAFWLAFPFAYPLSRGPAAYLVANGRLDPVPEAVVYYPIAAARRQRWLPEWYANYLFECGKAGQRAATARESRAIAGAAAD